MNILYAIQGTGNGHLSRAMEIIPHLKMRGKLDLLVSGTASEIMLPYSVKYYFKGISLFTDKKGGISYVSTFKKNYFKAFLRDVKRVPIEEYDLVISDFEPVSAWAARMKNRPCIALSNQCAVLSENAPRPDHDDKIGKWVIRNYAPASAQYGFHFANYAENIFTPIIRREIRQAHVTDNGHYAVYLPSYNDERILKHLKAFEGISWEVFSRGCTEPYRIDNIFFRPIEIESFIASLVSCKGIICAAGFATPSEALYLRKKLLVVPQKSQFEQHCNAAALKQLGVPVIKSLKKKHHEKIADWLNNGKTVEVDYPDITSDIVDLIIANHTKPVIHLPGTLTKVA